MDLQEGAREESESWSYGATLQKDPSCALPCSWAASDPSLFLIRGETYLQDHHKVLYQIFICIYNYKNANMTSESFIKIHLFDIIA